MAISADQVVAAIEKANLVSDVSTLDFDKPLSEQGIDSLDFSNVLFNLEEIFSIEIPDEDIEKLETVNQILDYVNSK